MARKNSAQPRCAHVLISFVTIFAVSGAMAANNTSTTKPAIANYTRPLSFEPNRGQTNKQVDFLAHGAGYSLFLSHAEAVMVLQRGAPAKPNSNSSPTPVSSGTIHMRPFGGNASAKVEALGELLGKSNYFAGSDPERWLTNIPNYAKVRYGNVYPGVDMIYYGNQRQLEYDFVVSPGADPGSILLEFEGADKAELDREGNVVMHTDAGDLRWHKPVAYQEFDGGRKLVRCAYVRRGGQRLGFTLEPYDRTKPLIIDPVLEYSTYLGGSGGDIGTSIAVDAHESAYITGYTFSADFPTKNASQKNLNSTPGSDAFLSKFDATGNLVYSTYLGGSDIDEGRRIAVDVHGNAYVTGITYSDDFPTKNAFQPSHPAIGRVSDAFVTKLSPAGTLVYSTYLGGSGGPIGPGDFFGDTGSAIAVDAQGNAYITGATNSPDFPIKNAFQNELKQIGATSGFVTKLCPAGNALVYSTYLGGTSGYVGGGGIAVDAQGNAYVTGVTSAPDFPTKNAFQKTLKGTAHPDDAFVTKLDRDGDTLVYSTYLGGTGNEAGSGIAVDASRNAYITGTTTSSDFPTKNAFQENLKNANGNAFVTKLDADGDSLVYSTYLGGSGNPSNTAADRAYGIAVDAQRNAYITGNTPSTDFPTKNAFQSTLAGDINQSDPFHGPVDAFVTKFDVSGNALIYSSYLGGSSFSGDDSGRGIAVDNRGHAYVTGLTNSADFPTKNAFQPMPGGLGVGNAFVTKISAQ